MLRFFPLRRAARRAVRAGTDAVGAGLVRRCRGPTRWRRSRRGSSRCSTATSSATGKVMRSTHATASRCRSRPAATASRRRWCSLAAMLAFPAPWRHKVVGLVVGIVAVQLLNIVRVDQPLLPRAMELRRVRMGAPVRVAGADHARRARRLADLGAARAALPPAGRRLRRRRWPSDDGATAGGGRERRRCESPLDAVRRWRRWRGCRVTFARVVLAGAGAAVAGRSCCVAAGRARGLRRSRARASSRGRVADVRHHAEAGRGVRSPACVSVDVNMLLYAFGMPLFAALTLAAREAAVVAHAGDRLRGDGAVRRVGRAGRLPEEHRASPRRPAIASQTGFSAWQREIDRVRLSVRLADPAGRRAGRRCGCCCIARSWSACAAATARVGAVRARNARQRKFAAIHRQFTEASHRAACTIIVVVVAVGYLALAGLSAALAYSHADAWTVWLASGLTLGLLLRCGRAPLARRSWPARSSAPPCSRVAVGGSARGASATARSRC